MIRTYLDSGILINAFRGNSELAAKALAVLGDPSREFAASIFLRMETEAKAVYNKRADEFEFFRAIFDDVVSWAEITLELTNIANEECSKCGVNAMDSLHIACANSTGATELITSERPTSSFHRAKSVKIVSLASL